MDTSSDSGMEDGQRQRTKRARAQHAITTKRASEEKRTTRQRSLPHNTVVETTRQPLQQSMLLVDNKETQLKTIVIKRTNPRRKAATKSRKRKWTEVIAPLHILQDEVRSYVHDINTKNHAKEGCDGEEQDPTVRRQQQQQPELVGAAEQEFLSQWVSNVSDTIVRQNQFVLKNLKITTEQRLLLLQVSKLQHDVMSLQQQIRHAQHETESMQQAMTVQEGQNFSYKRASRFLHAIHHQQQDKGL